MAKLARKRGRPLAPKRVLMPKWYADNEDLQRQRDTEFIGGVFQSEAVSVLHGDPGCFKTFVALHFASSISYGMPLYTGGPRCKRGLVLYVAFEDAKGFKARRAAWLRHYELPMVAIDAFKVVNPYPDMSGMDGIGIDFDLIEPDKVANFIRYAHSLSVAEKLPVVAVFIDVLKDALLGQENVKTFRLAATHARQIQAKLHCHVCMLHHNRSRSQDMRGPKSLEGAIQQRFLLERPDMGANVQMKFAKNREGESGRVLQLRALPVTVKVTTRKSVTSLAMQSVGFTEAQLEPGVSNRLMEIASKMEPDTQLLFGPLIKLLGWSASGSGGMQRKMIRESVPTKPKIVHLGNDQYRRIWRARVGKKEFVFCEAVLASEGKIEIKEASLAKVLEPEVEAAMKRKRKPKPPG